MQVYLWVMSSPTTMQRLWPQLTLCWLQGIIPKTLDNDRWCHLSPNGQDNLTIQLHQCLDAGYLSTGHASRDLPGYCQRFDSLFARGLVRSWTTWWTSHDCQRPSQSVFDRDASGFQTGEDTQFCLKHMFNHWTRLLCGPYEIFFKINQHASKDRCSETGFDRKEHGPGQQEWISIAGPDMEGCPYQSSVVVLRPKGNWICRRYSGV